MKLSPNTKILVVDDCMDTRNHIKLILRKKGFKKVVSAQDGQEALDMMNKAFEDYDPVELVLADWQMPVVDGITFLDKMKIDKRLKDTPFIMITSDNDKDHVIEAISHGVDNYIVKPIVAESLLQKIGHTIQKAG